MEVTDRDLQCRGQDGTSPTPICVSEQGVAMLSSVLHSDRAIEVNIAVMRAFVRLRESMATHKELARKLEEFERNATASSTRFLKPSGGDGPASGYQTGAHRVSAPSARLSPERRPWPRWSMMGASGFSPLSKAEPPGRMVEGRLKR